MVLAKIGPRHPTCPKCGSKMEVIGYCGWNIIWACRRCEPKLFSKIKELCTHK